MNFRDFLKNNIVFFDGAMGSILQKKGLAPGEKPEAWNITAPEIITEIHKEYFNAGSNVVNTNTFGANSLNFPDGELEKVIAAAVENAKKARSESSGAQEKFISLDIGPSGKMLKPFGDFEFEDAVALFSKTVRLGVKYGVDLITVETMNDSYETKAAVLAVKENCKLPLIVSNAYGEDSKLMTGASPEAMVTMLEALGADVVGANCSLGPRQLFEAARSFVTFSSVPVIMKPNAGLPRSENGQTVYDISSDEFSDDMKKFVHMGVRLVGGCCGTTPEYIRKAVRKIGSTSLCEPEDKNITAVSSYTHAAVFGNSPVLIGERINPTGKKRFRQALVENDIGYILNEAIKQQQEGAQILDVNVGQPDIDEPQMLSTCIREIQAVINLPLQIDTSDTDAMEKALRLYNGKAMINSVNGKKDSMEKVFPLVKKYGGVTVALTLDENGIPDSVEGRFKIAQKILKTAAEYGISKKDIVFDTLAMAVSAVPDAAKITLEAMHRIKTELGCHTSLGVSNISFGLPTRDTVNAVFFAMALENGLSAAIMNPYSTEMMKTYYTYRALKNLDKNCADFLSVAEGFSQTVKTQAQLNPTESTSVSPLFDAVVKGLRDRAGEITIGLLEANNPLDIVNGEIIPALDAVGVGFENGKIYLPQLLMSAEAAKSAFEKIKAAVSGSGEKQSGKGEIILATVHGDIHDIGKNIVKLLLENYSFSVVDLGKDVAPEAVADEVVKRKARLVGLSALMTTTVEAMRETIELVRKRAPYCKTVVGGAVLNPEYAEKIGADKYCKDAMETVRFAEQLFGE